MLKDNRHGFTLTEILVVTAIISVLAAILLPILASSRRKGKQSVCQSNEHQLGSAFQMYLSDYDSTWPADRTWRIGIKPHLGLGGAVFSCPEVRPAIKLVNVEGIAGYAFNTALMGATNVDNSSTFVTESHVEFPTNTVSVCEEAMGMAITAGPDPYHFDEASRPAGEERGWMRHSEGCNYLFCDGHVKWHGPDAVGYNITGTNDGSRPTFALGGRK